MSCFSKANYMLSLWVCLVTLAAGDDYYCDSTSDCSSYIYTFDSIYCRGYESCEYDEFVSRDSTGGVYCYSEDSCSRADISADNDIFCHGDQSCGWAELDASGEVKCKGYRGCVFGTIETEDMSVDGSSGAALSDITLGDALTVRAEWGVGSATISSQTFSGDSLTIKLQGYDSGNEAIIECNRWTTCDVECYGNACEDTEFYCNYGATCSYSCGTYGWGGSYTEYCPTFYDYSSMLRDGSVKSEAEFAELVANRKKHNRADASNGGNMQKQHTGITEKQAQKTHNGGVIHSDAYNVYCDETEECKDETLVATANVYCRGMESCEDATIVAPDAYMTGYLAGYVAKAVNDSDSVDCTGYKGCYYMEVEARYANCAGFYACWRAELSLESVDFRSIYSGLYVDAVVSSILDAWGAYALYGADVYSPGTGEDITFQMYGYYSGWSAMLVCESGDECDLNCRGNACYNLEFYCSSGATCDYNCGEYGDDSETTEYCPDYYDYATMLAQGRIGNEQEYDDMIAEKQKERKRLKQELHEKFSEVEIERLVELETEQNEQRLALEHSKRVLDMKQKTNKIARSVSKPKQESLHADAQASELRSKSLQTIESNTEISTLLMAGGVAWVVFSVVCCLCCRKCYFASKNIEASEEIPLLL